MARFEGRPRGDGAPSRGARGEEDLKKPSLWGPGVVSELVERARRLPEVREDKVRALRAAITRGTYVVDSRRIAMRMLEAAA
jgi:flagellar biosynthesis anti-sigma factor FlgM